MFALQYHKPGTSMHARVFGAYSTMYLRDTCLLPKQAEHMHTHSSFRLASALRSSGRIINCPSNAVNASTYAAPSPSPSPSPSFLHVAGNYFERLSSQTIMHTLLKLSRDGWQEEIVLATQVSQHLASPATSGVPALPCCRAWCHALGSC
jgi:hypothetical protein